MNWLGETNHRNKLRTIDKTNIKNNHSIVHHVGQGCLVELICGFWILAYKPQKHLWVLLALAFGFDLDIIA
jgi:hypothetical protein